MFALLQTTVAFLFVLGLVVTVHEFGHFIVARACGVAVDIFSFGFGPALISWRDGAGTEWRVSAVPLGGYVKFSGDENAASVPDAEDLDAMRRRIEAREGSAALDRYYHFKPLWQRALIAAAGPFANFVLSSVLFALLMGGVGEWVLPPVVRSVVPASAAERAGFQPGDIIRVANGRQVRDFMELSQVVQVRANKPTAFVVDRAGRSVRIVGTPASTVTQSDLAGEVTIGQLGLAPGPAVHKTYTPLQAALGGIARTGRTLDTTAYVIGQVATGQLSPSNFSGVVGIAKASGAVAAEGARGAPDFGSALLGAFLALLGLAAFMSVSIGFMNLLPVPVLDGGHLLFYAYEALVRRPVGAQVQAVGYRVGLALVLGLMVFVTWNDLQRLRVFQILGGWFS